VIDSHTHLDVCKPPDDELVAEAIAEGVTRLVTVGTAPDSCRRALAAADVHDGVHAALGLHPNNADDFSDAVMAELRELAAHPKCVAIGETGLDNFRDYAAPANQRRAFAAHIELARETGKPLVIHTRAAEDETLEMLNAHAADAPVILHCFSMAERLDECLEHPSWVFSFAGNVTYPSASELATAAERVPEDRLLVETDAPYLTPQAVRKERNRPALVVHTARFVAERRGVAYAELESAIERNAAAVFGW
jgi:TatD DNase family protein